MESTLVQSTRVLTVAAVAERLDVNPATVYRAVSRGELPAIRIGRTIRIPEIALAPNPTPELVLAPDELEDWLHEDPAPGHAPRWNPAERGAPDSAPAAPTHSGNETAR
jgi:excisionase family DNA binding protein